MSTMVADRNATAQALRQHDGAAQTPEAGATGTPTAIPSDPATAEPTSTPQASTVPTQQPQQSDAPASGASGVATAEPTAESSATPEPTGAASTAPAPTSTSTAPATEWLSPPASADSSLPWGMVLLAVLVLAAATAGLIWLWRRGAVRSRMQDRTAHAAAAEAETSASALAPVNDSSASATGTVTAPAGVSDPDTTVRFLVRLGEAMVDSSSPIAQVNSTLERIAAVNGLPGTAVVTFPTALMVSVPDGQTVRTEVTTAGSQSLRLDQVADVLDLAQSAVRGDIDPVEGLPRLAAVLESAPPSTGRRRALGYVLVAAGLSLVLGGGWWETLISAVLGGLVAVVLHLTRRMPTVYQGLLPGACAFLVAVPVFLLVRTGWSIGLLAPLVGPLVTFLPGALLTTGVIDLATRQTISGAARLASGTMQLVLLALGITAAAGLVGVPSTQLSTSSGQALGWVAPWIGVLIYAVGVVLYNDARPGALPWIALVLVVAYAGQVIGGLLVGASVSSFVGALAMTPVAMVAATRKTGPPFLVTFLPGFWVLVPGALGLVGVTSALGQLSDQAISTILTAGISMVAICLGVLAGLALGSGLQRRLAPDDPPLI